MSSISSNAQQVRAFQPEHTYEYFSLNTLVVHTSQIGSIYMNDPLVSSVVMVPAAQRPVHVAIAAPVEAPYRPAGQLVHTVAPDKLYLPVAHLMGVEVAEPAEQT